MVAITRTLLSVAVALSLVSTATAEEDAAFHRRAVPTQVVPTGWRISWSKDARLSTGASTNTMGTFLLDRTATTVTNTHVTNCLAQCSATGGCGFVNLAKIGGSTKASVVCALYPRYISSKKAKYTTSPNKYGGKVQYSYGIRSLCAPTNGKTLTCTPAKVKGAASTTAAVTTTTTTRTTTTTSSTRTVIPSPTGALNMPYSITNYSQYDLPGTRQGATLIDWVPSPCAAATNLTVTAMINNAFLNGSSTATAAYISQHGAGSDFDDYFTYLYNIVGDNLPMISPGFMPNDNSNEYYRPGANLAWAASGDSWAVGQDDTTGATCSSFDMYDTIINHVTKSGKFPNVQTFYFVGHSGGGNMLNRFSAINNNEPVLMNYILINAANQAYFTNARPINGTACSSSYTWPNQWAGRPNRYINKRFSGNGTSLFLRWKSRNVYHLIGDMDIEMTGTQSCQSQSQGGFYRRDRNYAYWAYQNILAGTSTNVSAFYGYQALLQSGAVHIPSTSPFDHFECTVAGVGHDANQMYNSACGRAAILGTTLPAGAGASYPPGTLQSELNNSPSNSTNSTTTTANSTDDGTGTDPNSGGGSRKRHLRPMRLDESMF